MNRVLGAGRGYKRRARWLVLGVVEDFVILLVGAANTLVGRWEIGLDCGTVCFFSVRIGTLREGWFAGRGPTLVGQELGVRLGCDDGHWWCVAAWGVRVWGLSLLL